MNFTEIIIKVPVKNIETASNISNMVVPYGIYIEDYSNLENEINEIAHINLIDKELLLKNREHGLIHVYISPEENPIETIAFLKERFTCANIKYSIETQDCDVDLFINNWKKYFKPTPIGNKLLICPSWENVSKHEEKRIILKIDPGLAFGTGAHETTRLCLEFLEQFIHGNESVLDIGCGSGILSVASLLLNAKKAIGVDIDELAVKTSVENAKINSVDSKFTSVCGNLTDKISGKFDIIIANIVADVIIEVNKTIKNYMHKDTIYIMSGIIKEFKNQVIVSLENEFKILDIKEENGWVSIAAKIK